MSDIKNVGLTGMTKCNQLTHLPFKELMSNAADAIMRSGYSTGTQIIFANRVLKLLAAPAAAHNMNFSRRTNCRQLVVDYMYRLKHLFLISVLTD